MIPELISQLKLEPISIIVDRGSEQGAGWRKSGVRQSTLADEQYILSRPAMHLNLLVTDAESRLRGNAALDP
jgi:hypothetical protein